MSSINTFLKFCSLIILISAFSSCSTVEDEEPHTCDEDALFSMEQGVGVMRFIPCYGSWAIYIENSDRFDYPILAASLDIPEAFKEAGMAVSFDACFYEFDLALLLADPSPMPELYVIRDFDLAIGQ